MKNTCGHPPSAGIDFEPNAATETIFDCVMRNCLSERNAGSGYEFYLANLDSTSGEVSITLENCRSAGDGKGTVFYAYDNAKDRSWFTRDEDRRVEGAPRGFVRYVNCTFERSRGVGVEVALKPAGTIRASFENCMIANAATDGGNVLRFGKGDGDRPVVDDIRLENLMVRLEDDRPNWLGVDRSFITPEAVTNITGNVRIIRKGGEEMEYVFDTAWGDRNMKPRTDRRLPAHVVGDDVLWKSAVVTERRHGTTVELTRVWFPSRADYVFHAPAKGTVRFMACTRPSQARKARPFNSAALGNAITVENLDKRRICVRDAPGTDGGPVEVEIPAAGFYTLKVRAAGADFILETTTVPVAVDTRDAGGEMLFDGRKPVSFWLDVQESGSGVLVHGDYYGSCANAMLFDATGTKARHINVGSHWQVAYVPEGHMSGMWRLDFSPIGMKKYTAFAFDMAGHPGLFFLSPEKTWRFGGAVPSRASVRLMSFNIWSNWRDRNVLSRLPGIESAIRKSGADVVLLQEYAAEDWRKSQLGGNLAGEFGIVGGDCHTPVLYRKGRFRLLDSGRDVFDSGLDASKSVAWAVLEDRVDGRRFIAFSTHLWHRAGKEGDVIRETSAKSIVVRMAGLRRKWGDVPAIGGGDLNSTTGSISHLAFQAAGFSNAMDAAMERTERSFLCTYHGYPVKDKNGIYHGTLHPQEKIGSDKSIDHVYLTSGIDVCRHDLAIEQSTLDVSDHSPVIVDFVLSGGGGRRLLLAGDSTLDSTTSWGTLLARDMKDGNRVQNLAMCGASTGSYLKCGRWAKVVNSVEPGDFVIIQFGHNDQKQSTEFYRKNRHCPSKGAFSRNIERFVAEVRAKGGIPVMATPVSRCTFDDAGRVCDIPETPGGETLGDYAAADLELGRRLGVDVIDMNVLTRELLEKVGKEKARSFYNRKKDGAGKFMLDETHPSEAGGKAFAALFLKEVKRRHLPVAHLFR